LSSILNNPSVIASIAWNDAKRNHRETESRSASGIKTMNNLGLKDTSREPRLFPFSVGDRSSGKRARLSTEKSEVQVPVSTIANCQSDPLSHAEAKKLKSLMLQDCTRGFASACSGTS